MRPTYRAALLAAVLSVLPAAPLAAAATKLLRFPDIWHDRIVFSKYYEVGKSEDPKIPGGAHDHTGARGGVARDR
jgi:hypothetical protein